MSFQKGFQKAMELVKSEFLESVLYFKDSWLPARSLVEEAVEKRFEACVLSIDDFCFFSHRFFSINCMSLQFSTAIFADIFGAIYCIILGKLFAFLQSLSWCVM